MERRVVLTGLGVVSPVGHELGTFWENLKEGRSGIGPITKFDAEGVKCKIGGEVLGFDAAPYFANKRDAKRTDLFIGFAMAASKMAVQHAGLDFSTMDPTRAGVYMGTGIDGLQAIEHNHSLAQEKGYGKISPFAVPMMISNAAGGLVAMDYGIMGPNFCVVSACATGTHCIGEAWRTIKFGDADVMIAGGSESPMTQLAMAGFGNMRALSLRNDDPQGASRPFDADRNGFVMGEGAGVVLLEELEFARKRGANILCEVTGYGTSADAFHPTLPHPEGAGASLCMTKALEHGGLNPADVQYVNAHGTATPQGDPIETKAIKNTFGDHAKNGLMVSSTKSMMRHLLGAVGGVEVAACVMAIKDGVIPPTINLDTPDPACDLDYVPKTAREVSVSAALSNSFGFGGNNASLLMTKY